MDDRHIPDIYVLRYLLKDNIVSVNQVIDGKQSLLEVPQEGKVPVILKPVFDDRYLTLMMAWRSNPLVYEGFVQQTKPLVWEEHLNWFRSRNNDWRCFFIFYEDRPVGVVTIGQLDHWSPEIGYYIGETTLWGKGIGKEAVKQGMEYIKAQGKEYCHTTVKEGNERSIRLLKSLGFEYMNKAREGEIWLAKKL